MSRGYRSISLAFGLILTAASPSGQAGDPQQSKPQQEAGQSLERVADALEKSNEPQPETADCPKGGNDRKSDLCAQWKAADAAKQAAEAADRTVTIGWVGVVLGFVTMGAAIAAAWFARHAALETKKGADAAIGAVKATREANEIARLSHVAENRAWLIVDALEIEWRYRFSNGSLEVFGNLYFVLKNTGRSSANDIWTRTAVGKPQGIWQEMWKANESPLTNECLPPEGATRVEAAFCTSFPSKPKGNILEPQAACIQISYGGGGTDRFVTECIWTISSWQSDSESRWSDAFFSPHGGESMSLDAHGHFGYFRTVT